MKQKEGKWKDPQRPTRGHQAYQHLQEGRRGGRKKGVEKHLKTYWPKASQIFWKNISINHQKFQQTSSGIKSNQPSHRYIINCHHQNPCRPEGNRMTYSHWWKQKALKNSIPSQTLSKREVKSDILNIQKLKEFTASKLVTQTNTKMSPEGWKNN